jgi:hypothetical protein
MAVAARSSNDGCDREDEREGEHSASRLRVDRHGKALGERRRCSQRSEADERASTVLSGREHIAGRDEYTEARQTNGVDKSSKPAGRDRLRAHVRLRTR